ncbi:MAG: histidine ammonia-lyase, partial [Rhodobacteraceae bacterium]|nr:histidine ammonia-lyase [Paracoccaceae bacterium]
MTINLVPGAATLLQLERLWRSDDAVTLDPSARADVEASAVLIAAAARGDTPV